MGCGQSVTEKKVPPKGVPPPQGSEINSEQDSNSRLSVAPARLCNVGHVAGQLKSFQQRRSQMLVERHSTVTSDDIYEFVTNKPPFKHEFESNFNFVY